MIPFETNPAMNKLLPSPSTLRTHSSPLACATSCAQGRVLGPRSCRSIPPLNSDVQMKWRAHNSRWLVGWLVGWLGREWMNMQSYSTLLRLFSFLDAARPPYLKFHVWHGERERERKENGTAGCFRKLSSSAASSTIRPAASIFTPLFTCSEVCKLMCFFVCLSRHREHCQEETHAYDNRHNSGCQFGWTWLEDWTISFCPCKSKISYMIGHVCNPMYLIFKRVNADQ